MSYRKHNNRTDILKGLLIDTPKIFIPWDIDEKTFADEFKSHGVSQVAEKYYFVRGVTVLGESNCNIGVYFDKTLRKIGISRDNYAGYEDYIKSFKIFQTVLIREFGQPNKRERSLNDFEDCEWKISDNIKIYHYVMDRFGLEEHLYIEHL